MIRNLYLFIILAIAIVYQNSITTVCKERFASAFEAQWWLSQSARGCWWIPFTFTEQKRQGFIRGHWQGLMLTDKAPEWKYPACPFNRISARYLREKYCSLVGCEYEWKCQSCESVNTFLFSIFLWKRMRRHGSCTQIPYHCRVESRRVQDPVRS